MPIENEKKVTGPGIRTWQFAKPLLDDKHKICLISLRDRSAYFEDKPKSFNKIKSFEYHSLSEDKFKDMRFIQNLTHNFRPDCIISISSFLVSKVAAEIKISKPIWFDRGDLMAEAQLRSYNNRDDAIPREFYKLEKSILSRGDVFSAVSFSQKCAVIGRLGGAGRLNRRTLGYEFVHVIPCGVDKERYQKREAMLRGKVVNQDDFVVLWSGGYNTWSDVDTLFKGLEAAISKNKRIKFVSTGGSIDVQDDFTYKRFLNLIQKSKYKERFIMLGWLPFHNLPEIYLKSDLGLNIDKNCYETLLGSRHRLLDWMKAGLPFITTTPSEFTKLLCNYKLAFGMESGDSNMLARLILEHSKNRRRLKHHSLRLKRFVNQNYTYEDTTLPLRRWVEKPACSPDKLHTNGNYGRSPVLLKNVDSLDEQEYKKMEKELEETKKHAANLQSINSNLKQHAANLEAERDSFKQHAANLEAERDSLKQHAANLEAERDSLNNQLQHLQIQLKEMQSEIDKLKIENNAIRDSLQKIYSNRLYKIIKKLNLII